MALRPILVALSLSSLALPLAGQEPETNPNAPQEQPAQEPETAEPEENQPAEPQRVEIGSRATVELPAGWTWLPGRQGQKFLESMGNPPSPSVLGVSMHEERGVFVVFSYEDEGHVDDSDAAKTDFDALLRDMKDATRETNEARKKQGYPTVDLLGWAQRPHYDSAGKKLFWAKRLKFSDGEGEIVNYDVRVLGRSGHLLMQAVGGMEDLEQVADSCQELLKTTEFVEGQRYEEFDPSYDKVAAYGIGGLIAGKLLLKGGLFKVLLKPLLIVGGIVVIALGKLLGRRRRTAEPRSA